MKSLCLGLMLFFAVHVYGADVQVYFSPRGGITDAIVKELDGAKKEILVQAYSFTSAPIAEAINNAHKRGVKVTVLLDRINRKDTYSVATYFKNHDIPVYIDLPAGIAHSKIMIIDKATIITGSFNFTAAAEDRNTEDTVILKNDPQLVEKYLQNFKKRLDLSQRTNR